MQCFWWYDPVHLLSNAMDHEHDVCGLRGFIVQRPLPQSRGAVWCHYWRLSTTTPHTLWELCCLIRQSHVNSADAASVLGLYSHYKHGLVPPLLEVSTTTPHTLWECAVNSTVTHEQRWCSLCFWDCIHTITWALVPPLFYEHITTLEKYTDTKMLKVKLKTSYLHHTWS